MGTHKLHTTMHLPIELERVFAFFSDAINLERITPPELGFKILTPQPLEIAAGAIIDYRLKLFGLPFYWQTAITEWEPPHRFVDVQAKGPYKEWIHTHRFRAVDGGTEIEDEVQYRLPLWPLGELGLPIVKLQLGRIFRYRQERIRHLLE